MARHRRLSLKPLVHSSKAIALPVTFLMLFVSLIVLITATYYFSMTKISAKTLALKTAGVEQEMLSLERTIKFISWSPGACEVCEFGDFGGKFRALPATRSLILNITDSTSLDDVFYNNSIGKVLYELPPSEEAQDNVFLKGDSRSIVNQSSSTTTQLYTIQGTEYYELTLTYRPLSSSTTTGSSGGKPTNAVRVYIVSFSASESITRLGAFRLKASCLTVTSTLRSYNLTSQLTSVSVIADLDNVINEVSLPISSNAQGAIINLETIVCRIKVEDIGW